MPVSFRPAQHLANSIKDGKEVTSHELLRICSPDADQQCDEILQSFLGRGPTSKDTIQAGKAFRLGYMRHGLVQTVSEAYLEHRALVLRPDDIWLAILTQFSLYVNKHAEDLREKFVAHQGKEKLIVYEVGTRYTVDFGDMAHRMTSEMDKFIVDRALRDWILPKFSTTTDNDTVVASVTMMATMKAYFEYSFGITCGIPLVVLEGERADWEDVLRRARKLMEYGEETTAWYSLLRPILDRFVRAFDAPDSKENLTFWDNVVFHQETGCGDPTEFMLTGWLSAFCVFSVEGGWIGNPVKGVLEDWYNSPAGSNELERSSNQSALSATTTLQSGSIKTYDDEYGCRRLWLDGMPYHHLDGGSIPPSIVEVDVNVIEGEITFPSVMVAGIVGASVLDSGSANVSATGVGDTIAPAAGWWLYVKKGADQKELISLLEKVRQTKSGPQARKSLKIPARGEILEKERPVGDSGKRSGVRKWAGKLLPCLAL